MQQINDALSWATEKLTPGSDEEARLEAEVLLSHALSIPRSYFYAWPARPLSQAEQDRFKDLIRRKLSNEPIAYIIGQKEFWSLDFKVTHDTLIPRPETEMLVEVILERLDEQSDEQVRIADLGTGCGAIGLSVAHEKPTWEIFATERMPKALAIAEANAKRLKLKNVYFREGLWCDALPEIRFDAIVSNPPYIADDDSDIEQGVFDSEPHSALFSADNGLSDIQAIIDGAKNYLKPNGYVMLEHGWMQSYQVTQMLKKAGYIAIKVYKDLSGLDRVTVARASTRIVS